MCSNPRKLLTVEDETSGHSQLPYCPQPPTALPHSLYNGAVKAKAE